VNPEVPVPAGHEQGVARLQFAERPFDEDVGAAVEAEVLKVDSRAQR
jgi:hypothetical protein